MKGNVGLSMKLGKEGLDKASAFVGVGDANQVFSKLDMSLYAYGA
jgi:hypothetical protein